MDNIKNKIKLLEKEIEILKGQINILTVAMNNKQNITIVNPASPIQIEPNQWEQNKPYYTVCSKNNKAITG